MRGGEGERGRQSCHWPGSSSNPGISLFPIAMRVPPFTASDLNVVVYAFKLAACESYASSYRNCDCNNRTAVSINEVALATDKSERGCLCVSKKH